MIEGLESIRLVDVLYRVSTFRQENEGDSLFNQRRTVETLWAEPRGIKVRRRIEVAESGRSALRLRGAAFEFSRRLEYRDLIIEYQNGRDLPDAVCVDWGDRWGRNSFEFMGLVEALRVIGVRLLAIGEDTDLTDSRSQFVTAIKSAVAQEQVRITSDKVRESRRSRRERARWQGGAAPDGYRTHVRECAGLTMVHRKGADGETRTFRVRSCSCLADVLHRDPDREATVLAVWHHLKRAPLSWNALTEHVNARGLRRPNGKPFLWTDLYRMGQNPHYAGIMTTDRWIRDSASGVATRQRPLCEQSLRPTEDAIIEPYITEDDFWRLQRERYGRQTRYLPRSANGSTSELTGLVFCPKCDTRMIWSISLSSKICGSGAPRKAPRKRYIYGLCPKARAGTCSHKKKFRVDTASRSLVEQLATIATMSDAAIVEALRQRKSGVSSKALQRELLGLEKRIAEADETRRFIQKERALGRITAEEYERDLFAFRESTEKAKDRMRKIETELSSARAKQTYGPVREIITWLAARWDNLTVPERAEVLRLLVRRVTIDADGNPKVLEYGPGFAETPSVAMLRLAK
jgi:DNA invertase Pin-like site-specific DNA recombinase